MLAMIALCLIGYGDDWDWSSFAGNTPPPPAVTPEPIIVVRSAPFVPSVSVMPPNLPISAGWLRLTDDDGNDWFNKDSDSLIWWVQSINASIKRRKSLKSVPASPTTNNYVSSPMMGQTYTTCGENGCQTFVSYGYHY